MTYVLSPTQRNLLETVLAFIGALAGYFVSNVTTFPASEQAFVTVIGGAVGYFVADEISVLKGTTPSTSTIVGQGQATWAQIKPLVQPEISKLSPTDQALINGFIDTIEVKAAQVANQTAS